MGTAICMPRFRAPPTLQPILRHYSSSGSSQTCHNIGGLLMVPLLCFVGISSIEEWRSFYNANWLGWGWGELRILDHCPALGTVLWPPSISLRTAPSHQAGLFQRKVSLHRRGRNTSTGATLTVFIQYSSFTVFIQYSSLKRRL